VKPLLYQMNIKLARW